MIEPKKPHLRCVPGFYVEGYGFLWALYSQRGKRSAVGISRSLQKLAKHRVFARYLAVRESYGGVTQGG